LDLQIVNLSKKYVWHRAPAELDDDEPELPEEDSVPAHDVEPGTDRWALRGINAIIKPGERVGIIGSNGSGKSTLLNILAGITLPSGGYVRGSGLRVLLNSLRTPFRGQLTGRQNLHVLAALLGVGVDRLEARIPEIVAFSDMEPFIDRRVMHYSTQQYRRLSFAAALMLDPEIILSDEMLGIGDARYQKRTEDLIAKKVEKEGVIFIFASNSMSTVQELCTRVIWLEDGRIAADGPAERVIEAFMDADKTVQEGFADEAQALKAQLHETQFHEPQFQEDQFHGAQFEVAQLHGAQSHEVQAASEQVRGSGELVETLLPSPPMIVATSETSAPEVPAEDSSGSRAPLPRAIEALMDADKGMHDKPTGEAEAASYIAEATPPVGPPPAAQNVIPALPPSRVPLPDWSRLAQSATEGRSDWKQQQIKRWTRARRPWLTVEKSSAGLPGLAELVSIRFNFADRINSDKSSLQIALRLEKPGTEVSIFIDGLVSQTYLFSSDLPQQLLVRARGLYFFTVDIDNVLLQPRILDGLGYAKAKVRAKIFLREPGGEKWKLLVGVVRAHLPGEEWSPRIPYPVGRVPVLKPVLDWKIEMSPAGSTVAGHGPSTHSEPDKQDALVGSGSRSPP
jgi:ABC-type polysaccharide/polyol phosphate transport system ATPase subunit